MGLCFTVSNISQLTIFKSTSNFSAMSHTVLPAPEPLARFAVSAILNAFSADISDPTTAIGGHIVGHASTYRIYLRRGKKDSRVAKLIDSPDLPENSIEFFVTEKGIVDE